MKNEEMKELNQNGTEKNARLNKDDITKTTEEMPGKAARASFGVPTYCPWCGGSVDYKTELIQAGPDCGRLEVHVWCTSCDYTDCYDW